MTVTYYYQITCEKTGGPDQPLRKVALLSNYTMPLRSYLEPSEDFDCLDVGGEW